MINWPCSRIVRGARSPEPRSFTDFRRCEATLSVNAPPPCGGGFVPGRSSSLGAGARSADLGVPRAVDRGGKAGGSARPSSDATSAADGGRPPVLPPLSGYAECTQLPPSGPPRARRSSAHSPNTHTLTHSHTHTLTHSHTHTLTHSHTHTLTHSHTHTHTLTHSHTHTLTHSHPNRLAKMQT